MVLRNTKPEGGRRVAPGSIRRGLMLWRSALRADCAAVLGAGSRRTTRCANCVRSARTGGASQTTRRAARADPAPAFLAAREIAPAGCRLPRRHRGGVRTWPASNGALNWQSLGLVRAPSCKRIAPALCVRKAPPDRQGAPGQAAARLRGAEERRARGRARQRASSSDSARLSERSERSERSELRDRPWDRVPQGSRRAAPTASPKRCGLPGRAFAAQDCERRLTAAHGPARMKDPADQTRLIDTPAVCRSLSSSRGAICPSGSTSCAAPAAIASRGMPNTTQLASSCTRL